MGYSGVNLFTIPKQISSPNKCMNKLSAQQGFRRNSEALSYQVRELLIIKNSPRRRVSSVIPNQKYFIGHDITLVLVY